MEKNIKIIKRIDSHEFSPWNALLDTNVEQKGQNGIKNVGCGIRGQFSTPKGEWKSGDCISLEADCSLPNILRLVAFHCQTSEIYEGLKIINGKELNLRVIYRLFVSKCIRNEWPSLKVIRVTEM
jgi:hypothetical protein